MSHPSRRTFGFFVAALLLVAFASNVYLTFLWLDVQRNPSAQIDSICSINKEIDCVAVATSSYSSVAGIPLALYGAEFYGVTLVVLLLILSSRVTFTAWPSLLFWAMIATLPISIALAWISIVEIRSICVFCTLIYLTNIAILVALLAVHRRGLRDLLFTGPHELLRSMQRARPFLVVLGLLLLTTSQFFWLPRVVRSATSPQSLIAGLTSEGRTVGNPLAPIQIVGFSDFECPMCNRAHEVILKLLHKYRDKIRFEHRDFPLDIQCNPVLERPFHKNSCAAAAFARCSARFDKFLPYVDYLFHHQKELDERHLLEYALQIGLSPDDMNQCAKSAEVRKQIEADIAEGISKGIVGTPTFFVDGVQISGAKDFDTWSALIDGILEKKSASSR